MKTLVINTGSSSIKFALFQMPSGQELASGLVEQIGEKLGAISMKTSRDEFRESVAIPSHKEGLKLVSSWLLDPKYALIELVSEVKAIGHRVVHGGEAFQKTILIDQKVKQTIKELFGLAPLHNPANYEGIEVAELVFPGAQQVAVFDTAFHHTLPPRAYRYAVPNYLYTDYGIRVYGFHGTSHRYVAKVSAVFLGVPPKNANMITIHLGNGASMTAIKKGKSIDTSLGMTPLSGLVMGTRVGDIDPGVIFFLEEEKGYSIEKVKALLNKESGMKGLANNNDLREIIERANNNEQEAVLALDIYCYRIKKYIGAYIAAIGPIDAIVFTAGVGENSSLIRQMVCDQMTHLGLNLDPEKNNTRAEGIREINTKNSPVKILVTPTNEELEIANQTYELLK
ncbi:MAG: acetate kinase [Salibacteraceae bacterium]|jgi:acetate kinase